MVFYFYTIIYSKVSFFLLLNVNAILRNKENQTVADPQWLLIYIYFIFSILFFFFFTIKVNVDQQLFGYPDSPTYLILCSAQERNEYRFGTTWEWVNNDRNVIVGWTIPLMTVGCMFNTVPLRPICRRASVCLRCCVYFHFRHNQLSLNINLVCFDRISANDNFVQ